MRMKTLFAVAAMTALFAMTAVAADITGKWTGQVPGRNGTTDTTFNFKQAGDKLTGSMTGPQGDVELKDGKVTGDDVAFKVVLEFNGMMIVINFNGTAAGSEIKMKRMREGAPQATEFTLKKAN